MEIIEVGSDPGNVLNSVTISFNGLDVRSKKESQKRNIIKLKGGGKFKYFGQSCY